MYRRKCFNILGPLLFSIYIYDLNEVHDISESTYLLHFNISESTYLLHFNISESTPLHFNKTIAKLNEFVNFDMKTLIECLHAKLFYKFQETEMVN